MAKHSPGSKRVAVLALVMAGVATAGLALTVSGSRSGRLTVVPNSRATTSVSAITGATAQAQPATAVTTGAAYDAALAVWRKPREKDSCVSCHGPDFIDLAHIGTTDGDLVRRAISDGASASEAQTLLKAVKDLRFRYLITPRDPRTFRPFQPGGAVLPGASSIERDAAFGDELIQRLPTIGSASPVRTLADAHRARDELLAVNFDTLRIGIPFPLWSADIAHGAHEGTMNDWIADLPRVPRPEFAAAWTGLQDVYLRDPSDFNFWKLYFAVDEMTEGFAGVSPADPADKWKAHDLSLVKYRATLIGQHLFRTQALRRTGFVQGQTAFSYLATDPAFRIPFAREAVTLRTGDRLEEFLPNPMWEIGDFERRDHAPSLLTAGQPGNINTRDRSQDQLRLLGYPQFVIDSINATKTVEQAADELRLSWFMIGMRFDPGLLRTHPSNSTKVGEYLHVQLWKGDYFVHRSFTQFLRMVVQSYGANATVKAPPPFRLKFHYFTAYNRAVPTRWNSDPQNQISSAVKAKQLDAYKRLTANMFRMSLLLHEEALDRGVIAPYGAATTQDGDFQPIIDFLNYANLPDRAADEALVRRVAAKAGRPIG